MGESHGSEGLYPGRVRPCGRAAAIRPPVQTKRNTQVLKRVIELIDTAQESLTIENAYVIPPRSLKKALQRALNRGVKIRIFTNSMASNDSNLPQAGYLAERQWLLDSGVELFEFNTPHVTMLVLVFASAPILSQWVRISDFPIPRPVNV